LVVADAPQPAEALARRFSEFGEVRSVRAGLPAAGRAHTALTRVRLRGLQATVCKGASKGKDKETSKGYGFVIFSDEVSAELACTVGKQSGQRIWRVRAENTPGRLRVAAPRACARACAYAVPRPGARGPRSALPARGAGAFRWLRAGVTQPAPPLLQVVDASQAKAETWLDEEYELTPKIRDVREHGA
jgi:hypothetical protein